MCDLVNSVFNPYVQGMDDLADLPDYYKGTPLPPEQFVRLHHDNGKTSEHLPECPQLHTARSETSGKPKNHNRQASYTDLEEEAEKSKAYTRKGHARRQRKEARRIGEAEAKAEAMKAVRQASNRYAQCYCCDALSVYEDYAVREEARTVCLTHTDGTVSFHLPNCLTGRSDDTTPRKLYTSPPKPTPSFRLEEVEEKREVRKKEKNPRRQPPKSAAYIDSDGEQEGKEAGAASPAAKRYDPRTIASDILRAIGEHPNLPPLNAHLEGFPTKMKGRAAR